MHQKSQHIHFYCLCKLELLSIWAYLECCLILIKNSSRVIKKSFKVLFNNIIKNLLEPFLISFSLTQDVTAYLVLFTIWQSRLKKAATQSSPTLLFLKEFGRGLLLKKIPTMDWRYFCMENPFLVNSTIHLSNIPSSVVKIGCGQYVFYGQFKY